jgi:hypothetical protein
MEADAANTLRCIMSITEDRLVRSQQSGPTKCCLKVEAWDQSRQQSTYSAMHIMLNVKLQDEGLSLSLPLSADYRQPLFP